MDKFKINQFLEDYNKVTDRGKCKSCSKLISWKRERVASHKRTNCNNVSAGELYFFAKTKHETSFSENSSNGSLTQPTEVQASSEVSGRQEFPCLYLCAKEINEMICSSAASERVWSIYRFIHSRLRNRLTNEKVEKLAFIYVNCAIFDNDDQTDYIADSGANLDGMDWEDDEEN